MNIHLSDLESNRFNLPIYRANEPQFNYQMIADFLALHPEALLIYRVPTYEQYNLFQLNELEIKYLMADTLVYYETDIQNKALESIKNNLSFERGTVADKPIFDTLVSEIFADYTNHYFSNPILSKDKIIEGYQEWVSTYYLNPKDTDKVAFLVKKENTVVGFATCSNEDKETAEGVLYGVRPQFSGSGIYTDMMRFTQSYYQSRRVKKMKVSTQIQNFAVQKAWVKEGFFLEEAFITLHIFGKELL